MTDLASLQARDFVENEVFVDVDAKDATVAHKELYRCTFRGGTFASARFDKVVFEQVVFEDCDLTRASFPRSAARGVRFVRCKLLGVHFAALNEHPELAFDGCDLRFAVFDGQALRGTKFLTCGLQDASFNDVDLADADFSGSDLDRAVFSRCELGGADLATATGLFLDPTKNRAKDALISVDAAVAYVRGLGVCVAGYDDTVGNKAKKKSAARRR